MAGMEMTEQRVALSIAGSDSGAGAGIQADLLTFAACGVYGTTAITCLTAQNPDGVSAVHASPPDFLRAQLEQVAAFYPLGAIKIGMVFDAELVAVIAAFLETQPTVPVVLDPVMVASSGAKLLQDDAIESLREKLIPKAALLTPNLDEAVLLGAKLPTSEPEQIAAARALSQRYGCPVLLKGGHREGKALLDVLDEGGGEPLLLRSKRIEKLDTHGSGCTLSSAIAAQIARGLPLAKAVQEAHAWLQVAMRNAMPVGGRTFINHAP